MKIYVAHYTPLIKRKEHILNEFKKHNINMDDVEFIETHDREVLTEEELNKFVKINNSERSLFLKHIEMFKKILNSSDDGFSLIFEDDAVLVDNFQNMLLDYLTNLPNNFDLIFPGECVGLHIRGYSLNKYYYPYNNSRGTCFYIINNKSVKKILDKFEQDTTNNNKVNCAIDWYFNKIIPELNLQSYWTEPTLVQQGSENGLFNSVLR